MNECQSYPLKISFTFAAVSNYFPIITTYTAHQLTTNTLQDTISITRIFKHWSRQFAVVVICHEGTAMLYVLPPQCVQKSTSVLCSKVFHQLDSMFALSFKPSWQFRFKSSTPLAYVNTFHRCLHELYEPNELHMLKHLWRHHGSRIFGLTNFPDFSLTFPVFSFNFPIYFSVLFKNLRNTEIY